MAIAGRVAIVPKGEWSQSVTYDKLDLVTHNGNTFIAYKSSVGVEPVDGDTWMLVMQGIDPQEIDNIINGTTPVGNALQLGGKGASEYALGKDVTILTSLPSGITSNSTMQELIEALPDNSILSCRSVSAPLAPKDYSVLVVIKPRRDHVIAFAKTQYDKNMYFGGIGTDNVWNGWESHATTADLAKHLPKSGGRLSGAYTVLLTLENTSADLILERFDGSSGVLGYLGFEGVDSPVFRNQAGTSYELLHTGNKPRGTYTGNGSSAERFINTGATGICQTFMVRPQGSTIFSIVTTSGSMTKDGTTLSANNEAKESNGSLVLYSTSLAFNQSGKTYEYEVL